MLVYGDPFIFMFIHILYYFTFVVLLYKFLPFLPSLPIGTEMPSLQIFCITFSFPVIMAPTCARGWVTQVPVAPTWGVASISVGQWLSTLCSWHLTPCPPWLRVCALVAALHAARPGGILMMPFPCWLYPHQSDAPPFCHGCLPPPLPFLIQTM